MPPLHFQSYFRGNSESTSSECLLQGRTYFNRVACMYIYIYVKMLTFPQMFGSHLLYNGLNHFPWGPMGPWGRMGPWGPVYVAFTQRCWGKGTNEKRPYIYTYIYVYIWKYCFYINSLSFFGFCVLLALGAFYIGQKGGGEAN